MPAVEAGTVLDSAISALDERQRARQTFGLSGMDLAPTVRYGATLRVPECAGMSLDNAAWREPGPRGRFARS